MRPTVKSIRAAILTLLFAGAAAVQIVSYFDIKAKDLHALTVGSWTTLLVAGLFIVAAVATAIYSFYLTLTKLRQLESRPTIPQAAPVPDALQLKIHSAKWGTDLDHKPVEDALNAKPRNALMFFVNQDAFPLPDPAWGNDNKYLEVTYSHSGSGGQHSIKRKQGECDLPSIISTSHN